MLSFFRKQILRPQLVGVVFFLAFFSCKKEELNNTPTGLEAQPNENLLGLFTTDTFTLNCTTKRVDSVRTDANALSTVGSYVDPVFGKVEAATVTQLRLSSENIILSNLAGVRIDSAVLNLVYEGRYGNADKQTFEVYEITENLASDVFYYSSKKVSIASNPIGKLENFDQTPTAPITSDGSLETPSIRIPIDTNFAQKLFTTDQSNYLSNSAFTNFLKGIMIKASNPNQASGQGAILYFNLPDVYSRFVVYYTNPDGSKNELAYLINDKSVSFNTSNTTYSGSDVGNALNQTSSNAQFVYLQSFGGTAVQIETPSIMSLIKDGPILVNYAKLTYSADLSSNEYPAILNTFMFGQSVDGKTLYELPDKGEVHYGGAINSNGDYTLGITRYIQGVLDGRIENNGLLLRELGGVGARSVIYGPGNPTKPIKLEISYTPISSETR